MIKKEDKVHFQKTLYTKAVIIAFIMGIINGYFFEFSPVPFIFIALVMVGIIYIWKEKSIILLFLLVFLAFLLGVARMALFLHKANISTIDFYNGNNVLIQGIIETAPDERPTKTYLTVDVHSMAKEESFIPIQGKILITVPPLPQYAYGDRVQIQGKLMTPQLIQNFDYKSYLAKENIFSLMENPSLHVLQKEQGNIIFSLLFRVKKASETQINRLFAEPSSSLMAGLLLGVRKTMPKELSDGLQKAGLTHIIAISGFNITIIISFIAGFLLLGMRKSMRFILATTAVILFTVLVGASPSVVRASIMGILGLFAVSLGRKSDAFHLLLIVLAIMTFANPLSLILDIGFQLSFLATIGLIAVSPILEKWCEKIPSFFSLKESLVTTLSAQIIVLPLLLFHFGTVSIIAPITNILVLPIIPLIMLFGFVSLVVSFIPFLFLIAKIIGFIAWILMMYIIKIVEFFASIPFAMIQVHWWNEMYAVGLYVVIFGILYCMKLKMKK